jgi:hypothetical protein
MVKAHPDYLHRVIQTEAIVRLRAAAQARRRQRLHYLTTKGETTPAEDAEAQELAVLIAHGNLSD